MKKKATACGFQNISFERNINMTRNKQVTKLYPNNLYVFIRAS